MSERMLQKIVCNLIQGMDDLVRRKTAFEDYNPVLRFEQPVTAAIPEGQTSDKLKGKKQLIGGCHTHFIAHAGRHVLASTGNKTISYPARDIR